MFPTLPRTDTESPSLELWRISAIVVHLLIDSSAYWKKYSVGEGWEMSVISSIMSLAWSAVRVNLLIFTGVLVRRLSFSSGLFCGEYSNAWRSCDSVWSVRVEFFMALRLFWIGEDKSWTYAMISFGFPLDGVVGGLWGSTACWLELDGKLLANAGSGTVASKGEGLGLATFFVFSLAPLNPSSLPNAYWLTWAGMSAFILGHRIEIPALWLVSLVLPSPEETIPR